MLRSSLRVHAKLLKAKMEDFGTQIGRPRRSRADLRFLKDVLYGLHGLQQKTIALSLPKNVEKAFFHMLHRPCVRELKRRPRNTPKRIPEFSSGTSEEVLERFLKSRT